MARNLPAAAAGISSKLMIGTLSSPANAISRCGARSAHQRRRIRTRFNLRLLALAGGFSVNGLSAVRRCRMIYGGRARAFAALSSDAGNASASWHEIDWREMAIRACLTDLYGRWRSGAPSIR